MKTLEKDHTEQEEEEQVLVKEILRALRQIRFGSIELIIHEARVVQIEKKEKVRL